MVHGICRFNCLEVTRARGAIDSDFVNRVLIQSLWKSEKDINIIKTLKFISCDNCYSYLLSTRINILSENGKIE